MNSISTYLYALIAFLLFTTCKKYPEGGFENRGPKVILKHGGVWYLDKYEVNGIDSTNLINYNGNENYKKIIFLAGSKFSNDIVVQQYPIDSYIVKFHDQNKIIEFYEDCSSGLVGSICYNSLYSGCYRTIFSPECGNTKWEILKLTKKEFKMTCYLNNKYVIILKDKD